MEIPSKYNPAEVEDKWYKYWMDQRFFQSVPDEREPYTIVIPPPNVTGVLHMGHMLNNTIQDILTRRARMLGKNACWVPGTDHASIATEAKVVNKLKEQGISKTDLTREEFLEHAWEWTHKHGGIILEQLKKLGASCDWDRTCFTMDEKRSESVIKVFVDLYKKDLIYRGVRMVNWDPAAKTALSDEEVIYKEQTGKLYYLKYKVAPLDPPAWGKEGEAALESSPSGGVEGAEYAVVATTRPETIFGDTAVCINPNDPKTAHLRGKKLIVPIVNRVVPVIEDEYVDMEFGTGCLKVTPAHDVNDYMLGEKYQLESIDIFNDNGTLNAHGLHYDGKDRFDVRKEIEQELIDKDLMEKTEAYTNNVGCSERTGVPIEPKLSTQWFLKMEDLSKPALSAVMDDIIKFVPEKFKNTYRHWMENVRDWNISRQLWWGHQIPAYYIAPPVLPEGEASKEEFPVPAGTFVVAENEEKAREEALAQFPSLGGVRGGFSLRQDEDCLDTWFSSWLWPISVFDGINNPENKEIQYYYPTNDLVTGPDIIFFWVARMIVSGYEYRQEPCFKNVYFTGIVRDKLGRKMSKQLGNSPDPLDLIASYGADGVRVGMMLCSPAGGDLLFDESLPQQGAGFVTKLWNSFRLVKGWEVDQTIPQPEHSKIAIEWFRQKFSQIVEQTDSHFDKFRISDALMNAYTAVRDEFSGWLLELVKPAYQQPIDGKTYAELIDIFDEVLRFIHPFMPFVSEEIWQFLKERKEGESIMISSWPKSTGYDATFLQKFEDAKDVISGIRNIRTKNNIANKDTLELAVLPGDKGYNAELNAVVSKLGNLSAYTEVSEEVGGAGSFLVKSSTFFIPLGELVDVEEELKKLEEELKYTKGFLKSVMGKLSNERFVAGAPEAVVAKERAKQADAEAKIKVLEEQIVKLK